MAESANFAGVPRTVPVVVSAANTNRDGTGTIVEGFVPGASGSRIERVRVRAVGTTTAGMVRMYIYDGTTYRLHHEFAVSAITPSATVAGFTADLILGNALPLFLPLAQKIGFSTHNAETFIVTTIGGDF